MGYTEVAEIQQSEALYRRILAAVWTEVVSVNGAAKWDNDPSSDPNYISDSASAAKWVGDRIWKFAAQPGWATAWATGRTTYGAGANLGALSDVITDGMILSAVQAINGSY